jgi:hypothetical protein
MATRKSMQDLLLPKSGPDRRRAVDGAMRHATRMHGAGLLKPGEVADLMQAVIADHVEGLDPEEFDQHMVSGQLEKMRELCGYGDDEDPDQCDGNRQAVVAKVAAHMLLELVDQGAMKPEVALRELAEYVALPDSAKDDPHSAAAELWRQIHGGKRLRLPGEAAMSDGNVDEALAQMTDRRGNPLMKRPRRK